MNKADLKKIIKPIVKECIMESLIEEGILSGIISEVVKGVSPSTTLVEHTPSIAPKEDARINLRAEAADGQRKKLEEHRQRMLEAVNADAYGGVDLFEGTTPMTTGGSPGENAPPGSPMSGIAPSDPGIDISGLTGMSATWKELVK
jgi:hypothetical protein